MKGWEVRIWDLVIIRVCRSIRWDRRDLRSINGRRPWAALMSHSGHRASKWRSVNIPQLFHSLRGLFAESAFFDKRFRSNVQLEIDARHTLVGRASATEAWELSTRNWFANSPSFLRCQVHKEPHLASKSSAGEQSCTGHKLVALRRDQLAIREQLSKATIQLRVSLWRS